MLFNSLAFAAFFPVVYGIYLLLPHRRQNAFLLFASYFFYGSWDWRFLSLIAISTAVDFLVGRRIHALVDLHLRKRLLLLSISTNLGLLGLFKYFDFFSDSLRSLLSAMGFSPDPLTLNIILPVGISFYTFQTLSYTIDVYRGRVEPETDLLNFAVFVAFFPQLVAGPIERAERMLPQIRHPRAVTGDDITHGLWFVLLGFFLKVFVADNLAPIADGGFAGSGPVNGVSAILSTYAFAFQIFGDFAGYSWIAIGLARMMGFRLSVNFKSPYLVTNPRDFWRHWHISLSTWLRDYLYIPMGGNRGSRWRVSRNLGITMVLGGFWHGAAWTFLVWGAFHGALLIIHRFTEAKSAVRGSGQGGWISRVWWGAKVVVMFQLTSLGLLIFRSPSFSRLHEMLVGIATNLHAPTEGEIFQALQILFFSWTSLWIQALGIGGGGQRGYADLPGWMRLPLAAAMFYLIIVWGNFGSKPFFYFQF